MKTKYVYVISKTGKALMPTKRFGKVKRMLKAGQAKVIRRKPFTIQLEYETTSYTQEISLGIDPGGKDIAVVARKENGEIVYAGHLETRSKEVAENMNERKMHRRNRRQNRRIVKKRRAKKAKTAFEEKTYRIAGMKEDLHCKRIKPKAIRFHNRKRDKGWLTPTAKHLMETHKKFLSDIEKILPIKKVYLEYGKFDIHKMENPGVEGREYQNGMKKGYTNIQEYVLCRDKHQCCLCEESKGSLHVHHVVWESNGGSDSHENLVTLCLKCHDKVHRNPKVDDKLKELFKGICKKYVHTTLLNSIMPSFHTWLTQMFPEVAITYGYETKEKRRKSGLSKSHIVDAYLATFSEEGKIVPDFLNDLMIYEYSQFRRHHRQIIHATRERNYKEKREEIEKIEEREKREEKKGGKIVASNRRKRTGQNTDSLEELVAKKGKQVLAKLRVLPGKKVIRSGYKDLKKGDTVRYNGRVYIIKGYGEMGRRVGFVHEKNYVPAQYCSLIIRNAGIVCL